MRKSIFKLVLSFLFLLCSTGLFAQGEANVWYFGNNAGLDFNSDPPIALTNGALNTFEGCTSISNKNGQLLFYSDGITVWNRNHVAMPNGNASLLGNPSSTQSGIIVPKPGTYNMLTRAYNNYYIVTVDVFNGSSGVRFSEVDMTLNGGLGDVILANRNTHLYGTNTAEKICVAKHSNGCDFWVIGRNVGEINYRSYLINSSGFNTTPVLSAVSRPAYNAYIGSLKASPNSLLISDVQGTGGGGSGGIFVFNFNNTTGVLSDKFSDNTISAVQEYSSEFSPDNTKLYYSILQQPNIYQYDLAAPSQAAFLASRQIIGATVPANLGSYTTAALQLGPDKRIYVALNGKTNLGVINNPNLPGLACNYVDQSINLGGKLSVLGLPAITTSLIQDKIDLLNSKICSSSTNDYNFMLSNAANVLSVNWAFVPQANPSNTMTAVGNPALASFSATGIYSVTALITYNCYSDIVTSTVNITPMPGIDAGISHTICAGGSAGLTATVSPNTYNLQWQPTLGLSSYTITNPVASPASTTIYTISSQAMVGSNLVTNGDFEMSGTRFSTQYIQSPSNQVLAAPGYWSVGTTITNGWWANCLDHTPGSGVNMMFLDGADGVGSAVPVNSSFWCQTISVQPNTDYVFSAWLTNANGSGATSQLLFSANGSPVSAPINTPIGTCTWNQFSAIWNSGSNSTANICISEASGAQPGNDFAVDDISFYQLCTITDTVRVQVNPLPVITANSASICIGQQTATLIVNGATAYTWTPSVGLSSTTGSVVIASPTVSTTYSIQGVSNGCVGTGTTSVKVNFLPSVYVLQKNSLCDTTVLNWLNVTSVSPTVAQGYLPSGLSVTATHSNGGMSTTPSMFSGALFPATYSVPINSTTIRNDLGGTFNFCFNQPVINPQIAFASIGNPSTPITVNTSAPYQVIWAGINMTYSSPTSMIGAEGFTIIRFPGVHTCISVDYIGDESYCNLAFGVMDVDCQGKPICPGDPVELVANGATSYAWNTGATTATLMPTPLVSTTYSVVGINAQGCVNTATTTVVVNPTPTVTVNSATICVGQQTATLTAVGALTYTWSTSATTSSITLNPLATTAYTVMGADANNCRHTATTSIVVNPLPVVTVNSSTICAGQQTATLTAVGAQTYTWSTTATTASITASPAMTGQYTVTGTDSQGCVNTATSSILVNPTPTVTVNSATICVGQQTATLIATGALTYSWSTSAVSASIIQSPSVTTVYTVTGTDANNCTNTAITNIMVNNLPVVTATSATICVGQQTVTLTAAGAQTYTWSTTATTASMTQSPAATSQYTVTGTNVNACTNTATATIIVNPLPVVTANSAAICLGQQTATLTAAGANTYTWNTTATTASTTQSPTVTTTYTVSGTDGNGCINTATASITVYALPTASFTADSVCHTMSTHLLDASNGNGSPLTGYAWDFTMDGIVDIFGVANPTYQFLNAGATSVNYTVSSTPRPGLVCVNTLTQNVWVHPNPVPDFTMVNTCVNNQPNTFDATSSTVSVGTNTLYAWQYGDGANGTGLTSSHTYANATVYTVTLTVASNKGCIGATTKQTEVYAKPKMSVLAAANVCLGQAMTFTAVSSPTGGTVTNWFWDFNNTISTIETNGQTVSYTFPSTGTKTISLVSETDKGCRDTMSRQVYINYLPNPLFTVNNPAGCGIPKHCVMLTDTTRQIPGPAKNNELTWIFGDGTTTTSLSGATQSHCYSNNSSSQVATYAVKLIVKTDSGCVNSLEKQNYITVYPTPVPAYQITANPGTIVEPFVQFINQSQNYTKWMWNFGDGTKTDAVTMNPAHVYNSDIANTYYSYLLVANQYGCKDSVFVPVDIKPDFVFYIPNAFSPVNKDDVNDVFTGTGIGIDQYEMWIYDRWGAQIYHTTDITQGWNGKKKNSGDYVKQDVYVWKVTVKDVLGKTHEYIGHVTVL